MWALTRRRGGDDRGAVLPFVGLTLVVLLGFGAIVIDAGALYQERRELQNGADAAALAVAKDCAEGDCDDGPWGPPAESTAGHFANENAEDHISEIAEICGEGTGLVACGETPAVPEGATGWVRVTTATNGQIDFLLAPVLDAALDGKQVNATAIAAWGPVGSATTIPLIFSMCEFEAFGGSLDPLVFPEGENYIYFHDTIQDGPAGSCPAGPSGDDLPGGFGWLASSTDCQITIDSEGWVGDKTGNAIVNGCDPSTWQNAEVLIPLFDDTNGLTGNNGEYHIVGFIGFKVLGYRFPGHSWWTAGVTPCAANQSCLYGEFTEITATGDEFGEHDFGARIIKMIG
jgi:Flp pilus assembly protein TadG